MEIAVQAVSHQYGGHHALDNISLCLKPGLTMLLGPNGAGKSTLFALITGLQKLTQGSITFDGATLSQSRTSIMAKMGVVFQQSTLDIDLSVKQNLSYFASLHGISTTSALSHIQGLLDELDLTSKLNTKVRNLNGGHRRRVELARCLIHKPSLLLLDEPTVGLDIESRHLILRVVQALAHSQNVSVLWATHLFEEVKHNNNLIVLSKGRVLAHNQCEALLAKYHQQDIEHLWQHLMQEGS
ncbi:ATP-binding cassette domain-containing protein [Alteromonas macleodii]|jgi:ABC-2 type transport system ATP-binding protein|uniref:ATP-binding cassette domain-containing protein n=1 Tax=Alteromonas macleodii TaxID=28108 RepID=UPI000777FC45|nr:ATP-binding cassette domain-containing protein [Alteromonas macleodii]AMN12937.1 ABC transporter ATP-binding protein [Alteromonas macleodii]USI27988.1 ATP-binding cassette domain-containing protein [Alteromonas macleodii]|tara:strand:- start:1128 stop:1850 length:723 start_codon:yes stop_codon:yes gene_type:complete